MTGEKTTPEEGAVTKNALVMGTVCRRSGLFAEEVD